MMRILSPTLVCLPLFLVPMAIVVGCGSNEPDTTEETTDESTAQENATGGGGEGSTDEPTLDEPPAYGTRITITYQVEGEDEVDLGEATFAEQPLTLTDDDAFVAADQWFIIYISTAYPDWNVEVGWVLVQDTSSSGTGDGIAEFRAQYSIPPNTNLDFTTSGEATFVRDLLVGLGPPLVPEKNVRVQWTVLNR